MFVCFSSQLRRRKTCGVVANLLDCNIAVSEFKLQSRYSLSLLTWPQGIPPKHNLLCKAEFVAWRLRYLKKRNVAKTKHFWEGYAWVSISFSFYISSFFLNLSTSFHISIFFLFSSILSFSFYISFFFLPYLYTPFLFISLFTLSFLLYPLPFFFSLYLFFFSYPISSFPFFISFIFPHLPTPFLSLFIYIILISFFLVYPIH